MFIVNKMAATNLFETYAELLKEYSAKFGKKTAIFLLVGSFYELYDLQHKETGEINGNIKDITDYLGLQIAIHKDQGPDKQYDGMVAGFPDYALHKWAGRLTSAGWTVVIVDQVKDWKGKVQKRTLSRILSPSTHIENISTVETPFLTTIYFSAQHSLHPPHFGVASVDLTTGQTITYSSQATGRSDFWTADTLLQNLSIFQPKEVLLYWHSSLCKPPTNIRTILGLPETIPLYIRQIDTIGSFSKELANSEYLRKAYSIKSLLPPKEWLGLRSTYEETALLFLLQFMEEHMPSTSQQLARNEPWVPNLQLVCGNHALTQLQIISSNSGELSVISLFTGAITPMGKRGITVRLLRPLTSSHIIQQRLDELDEVLQWPNDLRSSILKELRFCFDLPRIHRKVLMGTIAFTEFASLYQTYFAIAKIIEILPYTSLFQPGFSRSAWSIYFTEFAKHIDQKKAFDTAAANGNSFDITPFNSATYKAISELENQITHTIEEMNTICREISKAGGLGIDALRLEAREKEPFGIKCSKTQIQTLQANQKSLSTGVHFTVLKSGGWVETPALNAKNTALLKLREQLLITSKETLLQVCSELSLVGQQIWTAVEEWITHLDVSQSIAFTCQTKGFTKPIICDTVEDTSFVEIKGLHHPLVEASAASRVAYVKHDISLGKEPNSNGYLIYGMNASGKSTLMKATGVAVLLAQAGCYVPATRMELAPFRAIYTRILNHDNLFAGLSSFAVEMSEMRDILSAADSKTLVLGDELCSGTESISATALVSSGIKELSKQLSKFVFATHLHQLPQTLKGYTNLQIYHLHVDYDPVTKKLIYDRSLRPGSGSSLYGIEVARAMDLPLSFIEQAHAIRHELLGSTAQKDAISSEWNSHIVRRSCELCSANVTKELEVHHIEPRSLANKDGILPNGQHMNSVSNLIVICQACHDKHHAGNVIIEPLVQTSDGPERNVIDFSKYKYVPKDTPINPPTNPPTNPHTTMSKWSDEDMEHIQTTLKKYGTVSLKMIQFTLKQTYGIDVSVSTLSKMRKEL